MIYFDHAASTPMRAEALECLRSSLQNDFANPSANHALGKRLAKKIENARHGLLKLAGGERGWKLIFTSSATESNNLVFKGLSLNKGILYSKGSHPSVVVPAASIKKNCYHFDPHDFEGSTENIDFKEIGLAVFTWVNSVSGKIFDIAKWSKDLKRKNPNIHIHVDGVQGFGKLCLSLKNLSIDSFTIGAHKLGGPKGIAGLYVREGVSLTPFLLGGGQEGSLRASTLAAPLIFSFYEAVCAAMTKRDEELKRITSLKNRIKDELKDQPVEISCPFEEGSVTPYILTLLIPGISSDILLRHLETRDVYTASSSACSSKIKGKNPTFKALGLEEKYHKNILRLSFGHTNEPQEAVSFARALSNVLTELKEAGLLN